ncbi:MAG: radical SAM protein, partial [Mariprofundaceae bacterium]|nr:radical SAM protein [Mariprofundaceae bacterium]
MNTSPLHFFKHIPKQDGLMDRFERKLTYLRISVTDRCNMRCDYCRPSADDYQAESHANILSFEEIERIVLVAADLGVNKVRITGGEPLVRRDLPILIEKLATISGITDLALSTNATLLGRYAQALADAGLH